MSNEDSMLSSEQIEHFLQYGYVVVPECFTRETADEYVNLGYKRLGYDRNDPATWLEKRVHMPTHTSFETKDFSPKLWAAACQLMGGEDRVQQPSHVGDGFIMNFGIGKDKPYVPSGPEANGWHKDGDFFLHFLDSPEQGLLTIILWTDVVSKGGPTYVACDSVGVIARYLKDRPEGVTPGGFPWKQLVESCTDFRELTGKAGDVVLLHPYVLHATSQNMIGVERAITNPPFALREPMNFNRENAADFSPVELGVLRGLGVDRLDYQVTAPRQRIVPERLKAEAMRREQELKRLAEAAVA